MTHPHASPYVLSPMLTAAEVAAITGKRRAATQAAVLARMGVPFAFLGRSVSVERAVALAHALIQTPRSVGVDLSRVR